MTDTQKAPTRAHIDSLVRKIERLSEAQKPTAKQQKAAKALTDARTEALTLVQQFGEVPKTAPSSKRLTGVVSVLTVTTAGYTKDHPEAVAELREAMIKHKQERLFAQLFTPSISYNRAKEALNNFRNAELPRPLVKLFGEIFARTQTEGLRAPVLRIDKVA